MKSLAAIAIGLFAFASACAQDAAPPAKPPAIQRLEQLAGHLHNRNPGISVSTGGIDTLNALEVIADALIEIEKRQQPVSSICFSDTLTINEAVSPEAAAAIARELQEAVPKIEEACALVHGGVR